MESQSQLKQKQDKIIREDRYEFFIKRAHRTDGTVYNGGEGYWFGNLIDSENGVKHHGHKPYEKQFEKVVAFLHKAFEKFISRRMTGVEKEKLISLHERLGNARNTSDLSAIIDEALEATIRFKEY
jgi:hypothetical protein